MPAMPRHGFFNFQYRALFIILLTAQLPIVLSFPAESTSTLGDASRSSRTIPDYVVQYGTEHLLLPDGGYELIHHAI